jgi:glyoxylase-like metal-dependent hydrolase (beta-lactamase superfamily II)
VSVRVGSVEIHRVPDAVGLLAELGDTYPDVPEVAWEPYRALYPDLFVGTKWRLPCDSFLIRSGEVAVLVDTGVGPPGLWDWEAEREGLLPGALADLGVGRDEIDVVFLTHLHIDHVGWNTDEHGTTFFPRARYVVHRDALAFASSQDARPHVERCILALADRFEQLDGEAELAPGVSAFPLPGHYPGHMGIRVSSGGEEAMLMADAAVHPALLDHPEWRYVSDLDHESAVATRHRLLAKLVDADIVVASGHYPPGGIGRIVRIDGRVRWDHLA